MPSGEDSHSPFIIMLNETITNLTYESVTSLTLSTPFIVALSLAWFLPLVIYLIIACFVRGKSASGQTLSKRMIFYPNTWIAVAMWLLMGGLLAILVLFPLWLRIF